MRDEIKVKITTSHPAEVNLENMNITDTEMGEIAKAIKDLRPGVVNILLKHNQIGDDGAIALSNELTNLSKLAFLDLQFNQLDKTGISAILMLKTTHPDINIALHGNKIADVSEIRKIEETIGVQPRR